MSRFRSRRCFLKQVGSCLLLPASLARAGEEPFSGIAYGDQAPSGIPLSAGVTPKGIQASGGSINGEAAANLGYSGEVSGTLWAKQYRQPGQVTDFWSMPRTLWLWRKATNEEIRLCYWRAGALDPAGYLSACQVMRDVQAAITVQMDLRILDILRAIQGWFEAHRIFEPVDVLSGYRSRGTNDSTEGAAKNSYHMRAGAVDLRIRGVPADYLARLAQLLKSGGVGFYPSSNFIHVDVGRVRTWMK